MTRKWQEIRGRKEQKGGSIDYIIRNNNRRLEKEAVKILSRGKPHQAEAGEEEKKVEQV